jgi:hypothetical protein
MFLACSMTSEKSEEISSVSSTPGDGIILKKFNPLIITGDFDGDKKTDTITQHIGSKYKKIVFDSIVDPNKNHWDIVENWHFNRGTDLRVTINKPEIKDINLGASQGLYCLINIGDNNSDRKDEIALVVDRLDASNLNTCKIFSICNGEWKLLKEFGVNEDSFNYIDKKPKVFSEIKNYLEYKDKNWFYKDYQLTEFMNADTIAKMEKLKIDKCN